jgi:hypothetical protein
MTAIVCLVLPLLGAASAASAAEETIGKNPGKFKGRWLKVYDREALGTFDVVAIGETITDIAWKKASNEAPLQERELDAQLREQLSARLGKSGLFTQVLDDTRAATDSGYLRIDCKLDVEPGSRMMRYAVGGGAGKSRSILECEFIDSSDDRVLALYHGYGAGTGMGFKIGGGGAAKMTKDDNQENTSKIVELLKRVLR